MRSKSCATTQKRGKCRCGNGHSSSENIRTARCPITKQSKSGRKRSGRRRRRCLERRKNLLKKQRKRQRQRRRRKPSRYLAPLPANKTICSAPINSGLTILPIRLRLARGCLIQGEFGRALPALAFDWGSCARVDLLGLCFVGFASCCCAGASMEYLSVELESGVFGNNGCSVVGGIWRIGDRGFSPSVSVDFFHVDLCVSDWLAWRGSSSSHFLATFWVAGLFGVRCVAMLDWMRAFLRGVFGFMNAFGVFFLFVCFVSAWLSFWAIAEMRWVRRERRRTHLSRAGYWAEDAL